LHRLALGFCRFAVEVGAPFMAEEEKKEKEDADDDDGYDDANGDFIARA
jgi:hypothetical protein